MLNIDKKEQKSNFILKNSNLSTMNNKQNIKIKSSKKCLNAIEFIKDKNKFYIKNLFDDIGAKKFLKSKEIALMEIKLNDEIKCVNNKYNNLNLFENSLKLVNKSSNINENSININNKSANVNGDEYCIKISKNSNLNLYENAVINKSANIDGNENCSKIINKSANVDGNYDNDEKISLSPKIRRGNSISQKKKKKEKKIRKQKTEKKKFKNKNFDSNNILRKINDKKSNSHDSHSSHHIYKFIINNVNESEEKFNEKLEKEIRRVKTKRLNSRKNNDYFRACSNKKSANESKFNNVGQCKTNKFTKKSNIFDFSQNAKGLMESNDFDISSINDKTHQNKNESNFLKVFESPRKKEIVKKSTFAEDKNNNNNDKMEINSEHHSLLSILSNLM